MAFLRHVTAPPGLNPVRLILGKIAWLPILLAFLPGSFAVGRVFSLDISPAPRQVTYESYEVEATYIYKLLKFIDWPDQALAPGTVADITIGVFGDSPVLGFLQSVQQSQTDFNLKTVRLNGLKEISSVNILFISGAEDEKRILNGIKGKKMLTLGDKENFIDDGGMIGFVLIDNRVRFEVNLKALNEAGFKMSGRALSAAYRVLR